MTTDLSRIIENPVELDAGSVWTLLKHKDIAYSEGREAERYLERVLTESVDLSSASAELEARMIDWSSEYHLTSKRGHLLRGLQFDRTKTVLEVGCGCGAITRFLGETFDQVVSVEGTLARARLARMRTRDLDSVSILSAPFQEIKFKQKFDIIFCIGVFEYSACFVQAEDPYRAVLEYFADLLNLGGQVVLAIENQFGLKYFAGEREDHTNRAYEGIVGYPRSAHFIRTFGYQELKQMIESYFGAARFLFPYPDYKTPNAVLTEELFSRVQAGELVGSLQTRTCRSEELPVFDASLACVELDRNGALPFFANSFLVVAGGQGSAPLGEGVLGVLFNTDRLPPYQTKTRIIATENGAVMTEKTPFRSGTKGGEQPLQLRATSDRWQSGPSLQRVISLRLRQPSQALAAVLGPCRIWLDTLRATGQSEGGRVVVGGELIDCTWSNSYVTKNDCTFIDQEWDWPEKIELHVLVIRAIYHFLDVPGFDAGVHPDLKAKNRRQQIQLIAEAIGVKLESAHFVEFVEVEARFYRAIDGRSLRRKRLMLELSLRSRTWLALAMWAWRLPDRVQTFCRRVWRAIKRRVF